MTPGRATIHYTIPTPEHNDIGGADIAAECEIGNAWPGVTEWNT